MFNDIVDERCEKIKSVLQQKAKEYAMNENRFHNFDMAAQIDNETPEQALWGMAKKHLVSVMDIVDAPETKSIEHIDEKIGDMINYLILLEGLLYRREAQQQVINSEIEHEILAEECLGAQIANTRAANKCITEWPKLNPVE